jgi:hypothetical protein
MEGLKAKFAEPIYFALNDSEHSIITFNTIHLYYTKFKSETFTALTRQYRDIKGQEMVLNYNGLIIDPKLEI